MPCERCNLQRWWHCLKNCGKGKSGGELLWQISELKSSLDCHRELCRQQNCLWAYYCVGGSWELVFLSPCLVLSGLPERRTGGGAVCTCRLWAATCCNLKWYREQHSRHKSPRQLLNSLSGLEREGWPFTAPVLVYCPGLPAPPSRWPLPSVWVGMSRNQGCPWNLTWCAVERWPGYHWPFVRPEERLQSRTISFFPSPGLWGHTEAAAPSLQTLEQSTVVVLAEPQA